MSISTFELPHPTKTFLQSLFAEYFGKYEHKGFIEVRFISKASTAEYVPPKFYSSLEELLSDESVEYIHELNLKGYNIFLGVNPRVGQSGTKKDVEYVTALWADVDGKDYKGGKEEALARIYAFPIPPTFIVDSGHGYHAYWLLNKPVKVSGVSKSIEGYMLGIELALDSDCVHDLSRVMRLPGFMNVKDLNEPVPCEVFEEHFERRYELADFDSFWLDVDNSSAKVVLAKAPVPVPEEFYRMLKANRRLSDTYYGLIKMPNDSSRSGYDMSLAAQLAWFSVFSLDQMASIIQSSPAGKGKDASRAYLAYTLGKAMASVIKVPLKSGSSDAGNIMNDNALKQPPAWEPLLEGVDKMTNKADLPDLLDPFFRALAYQNPAKINAVLRNTVKERFGLSFTEIEPYEKTVLMYKKQLPAEELTEIEKEQEVFTEEEMEAGKALLKREAPLYEILREVQKLGLVGEENNALLHYLSFTSRILKQPISITVKGDSSAGKSYTLTRVMKLIPKSAYIDLTDASPQSFYYGPPGMLKHKIIVLFERPGMDKTAYPIRTLQSEGMLKMQVAIKNPVTGQFELQIVEKEGPAGIITTTTDSAIHTENETRNLSIFPDQSMAQTLRIYEATDSVYLGKQIVSEEEVKSFQAVQLCLDSLPVYIPFTKSIRQRFPADILRTRRDYGRFLALIEVSALFHQKQRQIKERDGVKFIRASLADYEIARSLSEEYFLKTIYEIPPRTIDVIEAVAKLTKTSEKEYLGETDFTITELAKFMNWDRDTVEKWLKPALKKNHISITEGSHGNKGAKYKLETKDLPQQKFLPSVEVMIGENPGESMDGVYSPITGQTIRASDGRSPKTESNSQTIQSAKYEANSHFDDPFV